MTKGKLIIIRTLVDEYLRDYSHKRTPCCYPVSNTIHYYKNLKSPKEVIEKAALAEFYGKTHCHQTRIKKEILEKFAKLLCKQKEKKAIEKIKKFDELMILINNNKPEKGIQQLTVYDTALRIGAFKKVLPEKKVYLHSGALTGAKHLGITPVFDGVFKYADVATFYSKYPVLKKMNAYQLEDFLCIYKNCIKCKN